MYNVKAENNDSEELCNQCDSTYCICNLNINQHDDYVNGTSSGAANAGANQANKNSLIAGSRRAIKLQAKTNARLAKQAARAAKRAH
jgi:hypothetical protein